MTINLLKDRVIGAGEVIRQGFLIGDHDRYTPSLYNYGTIDLSGAGSKVIGVDVESNRPNQGLFFNELGGTLKVEATGTASTAYGFYSFSDEPSLRNEVLIEVSSAFDANGAYTELGDMMVTNSGTIAVSANHIALGVGGFSVGLDNSGTIRAVGGLYAIGVSFEIVSLGFNNSGQIIASSGSADYASIGVMLAVAETHALVYLTNSGLISADYAFYVDQGAWSSRLQSHEVIFNSGSIVGAIDLGDASDAIINSGSIQGDTHLGTGDDLYVGGEGRSTGAVLGEDGADLLIGGDRADVLVGGAGADVIEGAGGDDVVVGGYGSDRLDGGAGFDTLSYATSTGSVRVDLAAGTADAQGRDLFTGFEAVVGSAFADTLTGSDGNNLLEARQGEDVLSGGAGDDTLYGGTGADVLTGGIGDDRFIISAGDGADTIRDFRAGGSQDELIIFGYTGYQRLVQAGNDTIVVLSDTDQVLLKKVSAADLTRADFVFNATPLPTAPGAPVLQTPTTITSDWSTYAGEVYRASGPDPIRIEAQAFNPAPNIYNGGTILLSSSASPKDHPGLFGFYTNLYSNAGGFFVNEQTGVIDEHAYTGDLIGLANLGNYGIHAPDVYNDGVWTFTADQGSALGFAEGVGQLVNRGRFELYGQTSATGFYGRDADHVWNSGVLEVSSAGVAIGLDACRSVVNNGTIRVSSSDPASQASAINYDSYGPELREIYNSGVIDAPLAINAVPRTERNVGLGPALIVNSGELLGQVGTGHASDTLLNSGLITGAVSLRGGGDTYDGRLGAETGGVWGGSGDDLLMGGASADSLQGEDGDDRLSGGKGADTLTGGGGANTFHFERGDGSDTITDFSRSADNVLEVVGYGGYRRLVQQGADTLVVLSDDDSIRLQKVQASTLTAGDFHFSALAYDPAPPLPPMPVAPDSPAALDPTPGPAPMMGAAGSDDLAGGSGADFMLGLGGDDTVRGLGGADTLFGGSGADLFVYGLGDGPDVIFDFNAQDGDRLRIEGSTDISFYQSQGDVEIDIGLTDYLIVRNSTVEAIQSAVLGVAFNSIVGGNGSELLTGSQGADDVAGLGGLDTLKGSDGNDRLDGGSGNDRLFGGPGNDHLTGGDGMDFAVYSDAPAAVQVNLAVTGPQDTGGGGIDTLVSIESLVGSRYGDQLTGDSGANSLSGGPGNDTLAGGAGPDMLDGGPGLDTASYADAAAGVTVSLALTGGQDTGGAGVDTLAQIERLSGSAYADVLSGDVHANTLDGGGGADQLRGGGGADHFVFFDGQANGDAILDLGSDDVIDLSAIDADWTHSGDQSFVLVHAFDHKAGEAMLSYDQTAGMTSLNLDLDGDGTTDVEVLLKGNQAAFSHFVL